MLNHKNGIIIIVFVFFVAGCASSGGYQKVGVNSGDRPEIPSKEEVSWY